MLARMSSISTFDPAVILIAILGGAEAIQRCELHFSDRVSVAVQSVSRRSAIVRPGVRELLGHKSIKMTVRYAHLSPTHKKQAIKLIDEAFSGVEVTQKLTQGQAGVANTFVN
jgi:hypothetical protein